MPGGESVPTAAARSNGLARGKNIKIITGSMTVYITTCS